MSIFTAFDTWQAKQLIFRKDDALEQLYTLFNTIQRMASGEEIEKDAQHMINLSKTGMNLIFDEQQRRMSDDAELYKKLKE